MSVFFTTGQQQQKGYSLWISLGYKLPKGFFILHSYFSKSRADRFSFYLLLRIYP